MREDFAGSSVATSHSDEHRCKHDQWRVHQAAQGHSSRHESAAAKISKGGVKGESDETSSQHAGVHCRELLPVDSDPVKRTACTAAAQCIEYGESAFVGVDDEPDGHAQRAEE